MIPRLGDMGQLSAHRSLEVLTLSEAQGMLDSMDQRILQKFEVHDSVKR